MVWGLFAVPERDLGVLGPVRGLDVVELPLDADDHAFYEIGSKEWATRWPAEELWVAVRT